LNTQRKPDVCQPTGTAELPMLDIYMPMIKTSAIVSAARLGLFEALAGGALPLAELAHKLEADVSGVGALADFLTSIGYLDKNHEGYANRPSTQRWLTSAGQVNYTSGALWTHEAWSMMGDLPQAVKQGGPQQTLWDKMAAEPRLGPLFSRFMHTFAQDLGPDILERVPVKHHHQRMLDLGGSHGLHTMGFCRKYPQLNAVIVDLPTALTDTPASIAQAGLSDRIRLQPGNLLALDWAQENQYDLVLYLSVGHNQQSQDNQSVLTEVYRSLKPGGLLVIHDYLSDDSLNAWNTAFRLTLLLETGTCTYSEAEYAAWLSRAGFTDVERIDLNPLEKGSLLIARR
jgi:ubiquinone/menaquinone biosynthesis C-methylase UbiE